MRRSAKFKDWISRALFTSAILSVVISIDALRSVFADSTGTDREKRIEEEEELETIGYPTDDPGEEARNKGATLPSLFVRSLVIGDVNVYGHGSLTNVRLGK